MAARWYDIGSELFTDDTTGALDVIKADHPNDASACCNKMFMKWLELQPSATWSQLITALANIGMNTAAENVIKCLCKGTVHHMYCMNVSIVRSCVTNAYVTGSAKTSLVRTRIEILFFDPAYSYTQ